MGPPVASVWGTSGFDCEGDTENEDFLALISMHCGSPEALLGY
jgi:hypothetical protein